MPDRRNVLEDPSMIPMPHGFRHAIDRRCRANRWQVDGLGPNARATFRGSDGPANTYTFIANSSRVASLLAAPARTSW